MKKVIDFLVTLDSTNELGLKDLTVKSTMLLALKSNGRVSEIGCLDTNYLVKHSSGYTIHFEKKKTPRHSVSKLRILSNLIYLEGTIICVFANMLIYRLKGQGKCGNKVHSSC